MGRHPTDGVDLSLATLTYPSHVLHPVVRGFNYIIDQGWAHYWGTSEWTAQQLQEAYGIAERLHLVGPATEQSQYNLFHRQKVEVDFVPLQEKFGLGNTVWSPLASGLLTGKYNDGIPEGSRFSNHKDFFESTLKELDGPGGKEKIERIKKLSALWVVMPCILQEHCST